MLRVQLPPEPLGKRSGPLRHEIPTKRGRFVYGVVRKPAKRPGREPGDRLWVQLPPTLPCVGWASASPSGCNPPACAVQVQLLPDTLGAFDFWRGRRSFKPARWDRNPYALLPARWWNSRHAALKTPCFEREGASPSLATGRVAEWQTRQAQNLMFARTCRFKSGLGYCTESEPEA